MNIFHWILITAYTLALVGAAFKHGEPKKENYSVWRALVTVTIVISLVILSSKF